MKNIVRTLLFILCFFTICTSSFAQKYGHVNLGNLLTQMPEVNEGTKLLETYQSQLVKQMEQKVADWQSRYQSLSEKVQTLSPKELKEQEEKLLQEQQELRLEDQKMAQQVNQKRAEIMSPILQKVQVALDALGQENGYTMIFDTSIPNTILYVSESDNLEKQVLAKLGINK